MHFRLQRVKVHNFNSSPRRHFITMNRERIELRAWEVSSSVLVLLLRANERRGFVRRECGRFFRERRCGPSTAHGHRVEYHCHREPLPSQRRSWRSCAKQARRTWWSGVPTAALRQFLLAYGRRRYVAIFDRIMCVLFFFKVNPR